MKAKLKRSNYIKYHVVSCRLDIETEIKYIKTHTTIKSNIRKANHINTNILSFDSTRGIAFSLNKITEYRDIINYHW